MKTIVERLIRLIEAQEKLLIAYRLDWPKAPAKALDILVHKETWLQEARAAIKKE